MRGFVARVLDTHQSWAQNTIHLAIREDRGNTSAYLMPDGTWQAVEEAEIPDGDIGIELPRGSVEAIAQAIAEWQGHISHADTEARVLREWLEVERARVDRTLDR